jgi:hypothetical protein
LQKQLDIRCLCGRRPLLAIAGRDDDGEPYIHIKTWKGQRLYVEVVITSGDCRVRCRNCMRWWKLVIRRLDVDVRQQDLPDGIKVS